MFTIKAICIPDITTSLNLQGLDRIVGEFVSKGYQLADSFISNGSSYIDKLDLILGSNHLYYTRIHSSFW